MVAIAREDSMATKNVTVASGSGNDGNDAEECPPPTTRGEGLEAGSTSGDWNQSKG